MNIDWGNRSRQLLFELTRLNRLGLRYIALRVLMKIAGLALCILLAPVSVLLHVRGFRVVNIFTDRIGHLAIEPDCLLKDQSLGVVVRQRWILLAPKQRTANEHLLRYWENGFHIVRQPALCFLLRSMAFWRVFSHDVGHYMRNIGHTQSVYRVHRKWADRPPLLSLSPEDQIWADDALTRLGLPEKAWFVCIHAREAGFSAIDEKLHGHRNSEIENTNTAVLEIIRRGGWVVRLGDPTMKPMSLAPQIIDYAHHPMKSARLDVVLCARARFILGNTSGICLVGTVFGVPSALANMIPITAMGIGKRDISIPKMLWSRALRRNLSLEEIKSEGLASAQYYDQYLEAEVRPDENSASDILELTKEMFDSLEIKNAQYPEAQQLQSQFLERLCLGDYSYGCASRPGERFLQRHAATLGL
jgi:putative glycosyltransferase (TIGR04372 family)